MLALADRAGAAGQRLAAAVRAGRLRRRAGAGDLHAVELAPARPPVAAASGAAGLLDQADRRAGGPDGRGRGGAGAGDRSGLAHGAAGDRGPVGADGRGAAAPARALRRRSRAGHVAVAGRHPRQRRLGAARAGAARDVPRHVQLRRPAVAVHRLLRALPGARPGLRASSAPAWCSPSPSPSRCRRRIGWGWLASRLVRPATLLSLLGIGMAVLGRARRRHRIPPGRPGSPRSSPSCSAPPP